MELGQGISSSDGGGGMERDSRVRALFERVSTLDRAGRASSLNEVRATDPDVVTEVEDLLRYHDNDSKILDRPVVDAAAQIIAEEGAPPSIGAYRVVRQIGTGGMGVVYEGEQDFPHRRVAIKVVRPELVTGALLKRFTHEAEALSVLRHPGIAQLFEAGFADGERRRRPFIAMELVEGKPLSTYSRDQGLSIRQRLELLAQVCDAVDHAHKRGVIHRDLKPGNILVGGDGQSKVLDFGVARLTAQDAPGVTVATSVGQIIGTLGYMSPEQFSGDPAAVDARSDVYALGVIFYEVLAGRPPLNVSTMSLAAAAAAIQGADAPLLGTVDASLKGDVESIGAKALEKDPAQRYQSAAELAADIRRYLSDESVLAHPQTAWYQMRKFARRNRALVGVGAAAVLVLMAGAVTTGWQAVVATRARKNADIQAQVSRQRADFLTEVIKAATPEVAGGKETTVRDMLDKASERLNAGADMEPMVLADTHQLLAEAYTSLSDPVHSETHARSAMELHTKLAGPGSAAAIKDTRLLAASLNRRSKPAEAEAMLRPALELARKSLGPENPEVVSLLQVLGSSLMDEKGKAEECRQVYQESWDLSKKVFGPEDHRTLSARLGLGFAALAARDLPEAERISREVVDARTRTLGADHADTLAALHLLLYVVQAQQKWHEFDRDAPGAYERMKRVLGEQHGATLSLAGSLSDRYRVQKRWADSLPLAQLSVETSEQRNGIGNSHTLIARYGLIQNLIGLSRFDEARAQIDIQQGVVDKDFKPDSYMASLTIAQRYVLALKEGKNQQAEEFAAKLRGTKYEEMLKDTEDEASTVDHKDEPPPK